MKLMSKYSLLRVCKIGHIYVSMATTGFSEKPQILLKSTYFGGLDSSSISIKKNSKRS
jgi:hypothetical protein